MSNSTSSSTSLESLDSQGRALLIIAWTGAAISMLFVVLRLCSRSLISRSLGWDDGVVVLGWLLNIASLACCTMGVKYGLGQHTATLSVHQINLTSYWVTVLQPMGVYSYCFPKLAVVVLLVRLMLPGAGVRWSLYAMMVALFVMSFLAFLFLFVRCRPYDHFWHPLEPADCMPAAVENILSAIAGSVSAISDLVLAAFPIKVIFSLQMKLARKVGISVLMGLGILAMVAAIIKTSMLHRNSSPDATYVLVPLLIAHYIEVNLVIICATAPFIPALFAKYVGTTTTATPNYPGNTSQTFGQPASRGYRPFDSQESTIGLQNLEPSDIANSKQGSRTTESTIR